MAREQRLNVEIECKLDKEYFADWNELSPEVQVFWNSHASPDCEGSGEMGFYCQQCPYCQRFEISDASE